MGRKSLNVAIREQLPAILCAVEGCPTQATLRIASANFCEAHAQAHWRRDTPDWLKANGLDRKEGESRESWLERMRQWRIAKFSDFGRMKTPDEWDEISRRVLAEYAAGKSIGHAAVEMHRAYLAKRATQSPREPGEDETYIQP